MPTVCCGEELGKKLTLQILVRYDVMKLRHVTIKIQIFSFLSISENVHTR